MQNYDIKPVQYGNTFKGLKIHLPQEPNYSLIGAEAKIQLRTTPDSPAVATFILTHIGEWDLQFDPQVIKVKPNTYFWDCLISFADGREKTYIGGTWPIAPVITRK